MRCGRYSSASSSAAIKYKWQGNQANVASLSVLTDKCTRNLQNAHLLTDLIDKRIEDWLRVQRQYSTFLRCDQWRKCKIRIFRTTKTVLKQRINYPIDAERWFDDMRRHCFVIDGFLHFVYLYRRLRQSNGSAFVYGSVVVPVN